MRLSLALSLTLISSVAAVLVTPNSVRNARHFQEDEGVLHARSVASFTDSRQKPLFSTGAATKFSVHEQGEAICRAGSRQWTGWIDVSEEKSLFFCKRKAFIACALLN